MHFYSLQVGTIKDNPNQWFGQNGSKIVYMFTDITTEMCPNGLIRTIGKISPTKWGKPYPRSRRLMQICLCFVNKWHFCESVLKPGQLQRHVH